MTSALHDQHSAWAALCMTVYTVKWRICTHRQHDFAQIRPRTPYSCSYSRYYTVDYSTYMYTYTVEWECLPKLGFSPRHRLRFKLRSKTSWARTHMYYVSLVSKSTKKISKNKQIAKIFSFQPLKFLVWKKCFASNTLKKNFSKTSNNF